MEPIGCQKVSKIIALFEPAPRHATRASAAISAASRCSGCAIPHQNLPVHHRQPDVARARRVDDGGEGVGRWGHLRRHRVDEDEVGPLADLDRADFGVQPERGGASPRRHPQRIARRKSSGRVPNRLEAGRQTHLAEHVEVVVAGRAVGAERDADAAAPHLRDGRDARAELEVRTGAMGHLDAGARASSACSSSSTHTQCAMFRRGDSSPTVSKYSMLPRPVAARTIATSSCCSDACVWTIAARSDAVAATASSSCREHESANRGANAILMRPFAVP